MTEEIDDKDVINPSEESSKAEETPSPPKPEEIISPYLSSEKARELSAFLDTDEESEFFENGEKIDARMQDLAEHGIEQFERHLDERRAQLDAIASQREAEEAKKEAEAYRNKLNVISETLKQSATDLLHRQLGKASTASPNETGYVRERDTENIEGLKQQLETEGRATPASKEPTPFQKPESADLKETLRARMKHLEEEAKKLPAFSDEQDALNAEAKQIRYDLAALERDENQKGVKEQRDNAKKEVKEHQETEVQAGEWIETGRGALVELDAKAKPLEFKIRELRNKLIEAKDEDRPFFREAISELRTELEAIDAQRAEIRSNLATVETTKAEAQSKQQTAQEQLKDSAAMAEVRAREEARQTRETENTKEQLQATILAERAVLQDLLQQKTDLAAKLPSLQTERQKANFDETPAVQAQIDAVYREIEDTNRKIETRRQAINAIEASALKLGLVVPETKPIEAPVAEAPVEKQEEDPEQLAKRYRYEEATVARETNTMRRELPFVLQKIDEVTRLLEESKTEDPAKARRLLADLQAQEQTIQATLRKAGVALSRADITPRPLPPAEAKRFATLLKREIPEEPLEIAGEMGEEEAWERRQRNLKKTSIPRLEKELDKLQARMDATDEPSEEDVREFDFIHAILLDRADKTPDVTDKEIQRGLEQQEASRLKPLSREQVDIFKIDLEDLSLSDLVDRSKEDLRLFEADPTNPALKQLVDLYQAELIRRAEAEPTTGHTNELPEQSIEPTVEEEIAEVEEARGPRKPPVSETLAPPAPPKKLSGRKILEGDALKTPDVATTLSAKEETQDRIAREFAEKKTWAEEKATFGELVSAIRDLEANDPTSPLHEPWMAIVTERISTADKVESELVTAKNLKDKASIKLLVPLLKHRREEEAEAKAKKPTSSENTSQNVA